MECNTWLLTAGGAGLITFLFYWFNKKSPPPLKLGPKDTVILHQFKRSRWAPSASMFALKLETYLRMANIPYQNDFTNVMSGKGKKPWITYNEEIVADSSFCIEYLNKKCGIDLDKSITAKDKAIARAFQKMAEENLYWCVLLWQFVYGGIKVMQRFYPHYPLWLIYYLRYQTKKVTWAHGIGRHTSEEVIKIGMEDLKAISNFLGDKRYMLGDEPSQVDSAMFGVLAHTAWNSPESPYEKLLRVEDASVFDDIAEVRPPLPTVTED